MFVYNSMCQTKHLVKSKRWWWL